MWSNMSLTYSHLEIIKGVLVDILKQVTNGEGKLCHSHHVTHVRVVCLGGQARGPHVGVTYGFDFFNAPKSLFS